MTICVLSVESRVLVTAASMNDICVSLFLVFFVFMLWVESEHLWSTWKWCRGSASSRASQSHQGCWTEMKNCDICYLPWSKTNPIFFLKHKRTYVCTWKTPGPKRITQGNRKNDDIKEHKHCRNSKGRQEKWEKYEWVQSLNLEFQMTFLKTLHALTILFPTGTF